MTRVDGVPSEEGDYSVQFIIPDDYPVYYGLASYGMVVIDISWEALIELSI